MDDDIQDLGPSGPSRSTNTGNPTPLNASRQQPGPPSNKVVQPKPQALPKRTGPSSIIVSPRQKGNPILTSIKSMPWEYGDIPADYVLGLTTCALFLSLKYHRIHPEYIYSRMKALQGRYLLRVVLVMVDISNHEESLRELSKTSLINGVTLVLCWSSAEGARYLELFKTYENAAPTAIKQRSSNAYPDRMVDFVTTPRSINKTDAVSLVSQFGTIRTAVNARHEDVAGIAGWGEKKVQRWCAAVREPFRVKRAGKRGLGTEESSRLAGGGSRAGTLSRDVTVGEGELPTRPVAASGSGGVSEMQKVVNAEAAQDDEQSLFVDDEAAMQEIMRGMEEPPRYQRRAPVEDEPPRKKRKEDDPVNDGVMAALSKLRKDGG